MGSSLLISPITPVTDVGVTAMMGSVAMRIAVLRADLRAGPLKP